MCSETSEAVGTTWEHAQLEFQNFLKIRITLTQHSPVFSHLEEQCGNFRSQLVGSLFLKPDGQHMSNEEKQKTELTRI